VIDLPDYICDYCGDNAYSQRLDKTSGHLKYVCASEQCRKLSKPLKTERKEEPQPQASQDRLF
jgi:hypothetical protein